MTTSKNIKKFLIIFILAILATIVISIIYLAFPKKITAPKASNNQKTVETVEEPDVIETEPSTAVETPSQNETPPISQESTQPPPQPSPTANWWNYPSQIQPCTRSGDDMLVLVNKSYALPSSYTPSDLVALSNENSSMRIIGSLQVRNIILSDLKALGEAAKSAGIDVSIISAFRSYATQQQTYNYWVNYNGGSAAVADQISARAGHSQHQLGTTIDFSSSEISDQIGAQFTNTKASKWLAENAWKYGFVLSYPAGHEVKTGFSHESWHYRYIGVENATNMQASGQILEEWLEGQN